MTQETRVIAECNADTLFLTLLLKESVVHAANNAQVGSQMINRPSSGLVIGVIDDDKRKPKYFDDFKQINKNDTLRFKIFKHKKREHFIVTIHRAHEDFVIQNAKDAKINKKQYSKYFDLNYLKSITKSIQVSSNSEYKNFLNAIIQKNPTDIRELKKFFKKKLWN